MKWRNAEVLSLAMGKDVTDMLKKEYYKRKFFNLENDQQKGLKGLIKKKKESRMIYFGTDKSEKMSVNTIDNFTEKIEPTCRWRRRWTLSC